MYFNSLNRFRAISPQFGGTGQKSAPKRLIFHDGGSSSGVGSA
jgi:hypothetical protein